MSIGKGKTSNKNRIKSVVTFQDNNGFYHIKAKTYDDLWYEYKYYHVETTEVTRIIGSILVKGYTNSKSWNLIRTDENWKSDILTEIDTLTEDLNEIRLLFDNNEYDDNKRLKIEVYEIYEECLDKINLQIDIIHNKQTELDER